MRVMAVGTEQIGSLSGPCEISRSFSVDACPPIPVKVPVAFATEPVAFGKVYQFSVKKAELVPVFRIMTIKAPPHGFCMMHPDFRMLFF
jgi:hypothetical protein